MAAKFDYSLDYKNLDLRKNPELYRVGKGEQGVLLVEKHGDPELRDAGISAGHAILSGPRPGMPWDQNLYSLDYTELSLVISASAIAESSDANADCCLRPKTDVANATCVFHPAGLFTTSKCSSSKRISDIEVMMPGEA